MTAVPQHMLALTGANETRLALASIKRHARSLPTRAGAEFVADVIENDHDHPRIGTIRMLPLLTSVHYVGTDKAHRCLKMAGVLNEDKRLRELTARQRQAVADQLRLFASTFQGQ